MVVSPDSTTLYVAAAATGTLYSCSIAASSCALLAQTNSVVTGGLQVSPNGETLYAGLQNGQLLACATATPNACTVLANAAVASFRQINSIALSADGATLWAGVGGWNDGGAYSDGYLWSCPTATPNACVVWASSKPNVGAMTTAGSSPGSPVYFFTAAPFTSGSPNAGTTYLSVCPTNAAPQEPTNWSQLGWPSYCPAHAIGSTCGTACLQYDLVTNMVANAANTTLWFLASEPTGEVFLGSAPTNLVTGVAWNGVSIVLGPSIYSYPGALSISADGNYLFFTVLNKSTSYVELFQCNLANGWAKVTCTSGLLGTASASDPGAAPVAWGQYSA
jgi:hypothetical protein